MTAYENLNFFGKLYNIPSAERETRINNLLNQVGLKKRATSLVRTFSRGMQQRLSIARALLNQPDVLFFDEPYTGLDQDAGDMLEDLLKTAHSENRTVVMTTHQLHRASNIASRAVILSRGKIAYDEHISGMSSADLTAIYAQVTGSASTR